LILEIEKLLDDYHPAEIKIFISAEQKQKKRIGAKKSEGSYNPLRSVCQAVTMHF
jgi:hypothetical protein